MMLIGGALGSLSSHGHEETLAIRRGDVRVGGRETQLVDLGQILDWNKARGVPTSTLACPTRSARPSTACRQTGTESPGCPHPTPVTCLLRRIPAAGCSPEGKLATHTSSFPDASVS